MNIETLTKKLGIHEKTLKIPTRYMPEVLNILTYMKNETKKRAKK